MKTIYVIMFCLVCGLTATASPVYVFEFNMIEKTVTSSYTTNCLLSSAIGQDHARVFVTKKQYEAGFKLLPAKVIDDAIAAAKDYEADPEKMDKNTKAILKAWMALLNKRFSGSDKVSLGELKQAIKDELEGDKP